MPLVYGDKLEVVPPKSLSHWMLCPDYQPRSEPTTHAVSPMPSARMTGVGVQDSFELEECYGPMYSYSGDVNFD